VHVLRTILRPSVASDKIIGVHKYDGVYSVKQVNIDIRQSFTRYASPPGDEMTATSQRRWKTPDIPAVEARESHYTVYCNGVRGYAAYPLRGYTQGAICWLNQWVGNRGNRGKLLAYERTNMGKNGTI